MKIYIIADKASKEHLLLEIESIKSKYFDNINVTVVASVGKVKLTKFILIFEDDVDAFLKISKAALLSKEFNEVVICDRVITSLEAIKEISEIPSLISLDFKIGDEATMYKDTQNIYTNLKAKFPNVEVIGYTNYESPSEDEVGNQAKRLLDLLTTDNQSVYDKYSLSYPESLANIFRDKIRISQNDIAIKNLEHKLTYVDTNLPESSGKDYLVGKAMSMRLLYRDMQHLKGANPRVLIRGERGTGKELVATAIYEDSPIGQNTAFPFISVDCGTFPKLDSIAIKSLLFGHIAGSYTDAKKDKKGIFELANNGTVFLDEVGNIPYDVQGMLSRYLETGEFYRHGDDEKMYRSNVRLICATNSDLESMMKNDTFRKDFYDRIAIVVIRIPSLSERREDIPALAEYIITNKKILTQNFGNDKVRFSISTNAKEFLSNLDFEGNVRALKNILVRSMLKAKARDNEISVSDIELSLDKNVSKQTDSSNRDCSAAIEFLNQIQAIVNKNFKNQQRVTQGDIIKHFVTKTGQKGFNHRTAFITDYLTPNKSCIESLIADPNNPWKEVCQKCSFIRNSKPKK